MESTKSTLKQAWDYVSNIFSSSLPTFQGLDSVQQMKKMFNEDESLLE